MYYTGITRVAAAHNWKNARLAARTRACEDMLFAKAQRFTKAIHPLIAVFLHVKRKAEYEANEDPSTRQRVMCPVD